MVGYRVKLRSQGSGVWLQWCCETVGEVNGGSFVRLMQSLVESVLLYGTEVWGCHASWRG